jgi:SAM-dependent methyltransferase
MPILLIVMQVIQALLLFGAFLMVLWLIQLAVPGLMDGAPFVGSQPDRQKKMIDLLALKPGETVLDLGSGDGRLLVAAAERGCHVIGYEANLFLVWYSRLWLWRRGFGSRSAIHWGDFWRADWSAADAVMLYGFPTIMARLEKKFAAELKPGARIVSATFQLPTWPPTATAGDVFLYKKVSDTFGRLS